MIGLAGAGDLVATALARESRNRRAGELLAAGVPASEIPARIGQAVEALESVPLLARALERGRVRRTGHERARTADLGRAPAGRLGRPGAGDGTSPRALAPPPAGLLAPPVAARDGTLAALPRERRADMDMLLVVLSKRGIGCYRVGMSTVTRHKTSFEIDTAKVAAVKDILGTKTLTDTVDAALSEVVKLRQRRNLLELLSTPGALELDDPDVMAGAWR